jgi:hypothetical protein
MTIERVLEECVRELQRQIAFKKQAKEFQRNAQHQQQLQLAAAAVKAASMRANSAFALEHSKLPPRSEQRAPATEEKSAAEGMSRNEEKRAAVPSSAPASAVIATRSASPARVSNVSPASASPLSVASAETSPPSPAAHVERSASPLHIDDAESSRTPETPASAANSRPVAHDHDDKKDNGSSAESQPEHDKAALAIADPTPLTPPTLSDGEEEESGDDDGEDALYGLELESDLSYASPHHSSYNSPSIGHRRSSDMPRSPDDGRGRALSSNNLSALSLAEAADAFALPPSSPSVPVPVSPPVPATGVAASVASVSLLGAMRAASPLRTALSSKLVQPLAYLASAAAGGRPAAGSNATDSKAQPAGTQPSQ